ncbi:MAG: metallophosphoesterase [Desulfobacterales bacterium]|nr:metallophosphoesterase [Desulfobacterales bacterium]
MRIFAISDIHIDFEENFTWVYKLSETDYVNDILILAGDVTDQTRLLRDVFVKLRRSFHRLCFIPGNHDLWIYRDHDVDSLSRFQTIQRIAADCGVDMEAIQLGQVTIVPLHSWYDYSFGQPSPYLKQVWMDYMACSWPNHYNEQAITHHFASMNEKNLSKDNDHIISFSHFLPRIDLMPISIPLQQRTLYPILGSTILGMQVAQLKPSIHIYGHSHVNQEIQIDSTLYINNAFGYPYERHIAAKRLKCILSI